MRTRDGTKKLMLMLAMYVGVGKRCEKAVCRGGCLPVAKGGKKIANRDSMPAASDEVSDEYDNAV